MTKFGNFRFFYLAQSWGENCWEALLSNIHKQVSTTKSLGVLFDNNMAWHSHMDTLSKKIASGIGAIEQSKPFVSPERLHYIYNALVQPHFDFCSIVWGNCGKTLSEKLQQL